MTEQYIHSAQNPLIKDYKKLLTGSRQRKKLGKIALEGPNLIEGALDAGLTPEVVFYTKNYYDSKGKLLISRLPTATRRVVLAEGLFDEIAETDHPREVAAILPFNAEKVQSRQYDKTKLIMILDRLQDPGNMGTIIRTAAAAGIDLIYYTRGSVDPYSTKVMRSTAGLIFHIPVILLDAPSLKLKNLKQEGLKIVAASKKGQNLWQADYGEKTAIIIGNEAGGISEELLELADLKVTVPIEEPVESLNAATAAAVITYEIVRRSRKMP